MSTKEKWLTILVCLCILILCAGFGLFRKKEVSSGILSVSELNGKVLGGVESRMPENSAKIFFESMLGVKLAGYRAYKNMDEALYALKTGEVAALWTTDVTAEYLTAAGGYGQSAQNADAAKEALTDGEDKPQYRIVDTSGCSGIMELPEGRFDFGFAAKNDQYGERVISNLNLAIEALKADGKLEELIRNFIYDEGNAEQFGIKDMVSQTADYKRTHEQIGTIRVGITGAVPPVELIDEKGEPYGFSAAFMDEIACRLGCCVEFEVLDNETAFTGLMSGSVDAIFCYGTPGQVTTEGTRKWLTSEGYLRCEEYRLISVSND